MNGRRLSDFLPLLPGEEIVLAGLRNGHIDRIGDGRRPVSRARDREIRAPFLRFLLLGGDDEARPLEKGILLKGAWIHEPLDLEGCRVPRGLELRACHFDDTPILRGAIIDSVRFEGSRLPGLEAEGLETRGSLILAGAEILGPIALAGSKLGGALVLDDARLTLPEGASLGAEALSARRLSARRAVLRGSLLLTGARLIGDVDLSHIVIESPDPPALCANGIETQANLLLRGAAIRGETSLVGAKVAGDLDCSGARFSHEGAIALHLGRANVEGAFFLRAGARVSGVLDLTGASFGVLNDDLECWPEAGELRLNRCLYGAIIDSDLDVSRRLAWLARQTPARWGADFWPQPYEQLANAYRTMGHEEDARRVLIEKERLQRRARRARAGNPLHRSLLLAIDGMLGLSIRYGRAPFLSFVWLILFWAVGVGVFAFAEGQGAFKPASPLLLRSPEWLLCAIPPEESRTPPGAASPQPGRAVPGQNQLDCFRAQWEARSYPGFNPWMYSLDTLFPVLEIDQKSFWRVDPTRDWGRPTKAYFYFQSMIGWILSVLAIAGFTGFVRMT